MKKKLNIEGVTNELKGGSAFFPNYNHGNSPATDSPSTDIKETEQRPLDPELSSRTQESVNKHITPLPQTTAKESSPRDTMIPRYHDTTVSRIHDTIHPSPDDDIFEIVRKAVKQLGKEAATYRFTVNEKNHLADIKYTYKRQGINTSENEITRISINYFVEDYRKNGEESLLAKILKRLNS